MSGCLAVAVGLFVLWSWRWPLVGDAALIHYIGFMVEKGWVPYRDLGDMNMPGAFLVEMGAMRVFGGGDLGWRVFDFFLLGTAGFCFQVLTRRAGWFAGWFAAALFALVHGRDGLAEGGQRDLTVAVLLLGSTACLCWGLRRRIRWGMLGFGLLAGVALTVKPTTGLISLGQLGVAGWVLWREPAHQSRWTGHGVAWGLAGMVVGPAGAGWWLWRLGAWGAFWHGLRTVVPFYASLGHRPLGYLLVHSVSPLLALVVVWIGVLAVARPRWGWERGVLGVGVVFGLVSYVVQARGLPYYRYPLLAFLLPLMGVDFAEVMAGRWGSVRGRVAGGLAVAGLAVGGFWVGPQSAFLVHQYRWWETDFISSLEGNLRRIEGVGPTVETHISEARCGAPGVVPMPGPVPALLPGAEVGCGTPGPLVGEGLSGRVQCVDSISGCGNVLYRMRLEPATGVLSDFLLFGPEQVGAVREARATFVEGVSKRPPEVVVVSSWLHMDGPDGYGKLAKWPWMEAWLAGEYRLETEWRPGRTARWWSREEVPKGYRVYVRKARTGATTGRDPLRKLGEPNCVRVHCGGGPSVGAGSNPPGSTIKLPEPGAPDFLRE